MTTFFPPFLRSRDLAFGSPALLILFRIIKIIYRYVVPPRPDPLFDSALLSYSLPLLGPLSPQPLDI